MLFYDSQEVTKTKNLVFGLTTFSESQLKAAK